MTDQLTFETVGIAVVILMAAVYAYLAIKKDVRESRLASMETPPASEKFATKKELFDVQAQMQSQFIRIDARLVDMAKDSSENREKLYNKINSAKEDLAELRKSDEIRGQEIRALSLKLDRFLENCKIQHSK